MSTDVRQPAAAGSPTGKVSAGWVVVVGVLATLLGLGGGYLIFGGTAGASPATGQIRQLIDDYYAAWDAGDGELAASYMTEDGAYFDSADGIAKLANDDGWRGLAAEVEEYEWASFEAAEDTLVVTEGPPYAVANVVRVGDPASTDEHNYFEALDAFIVVEDETGQLKIAVHSNEIRGISDWSPAQ